MSPVSRLQQLSKAACAVVPAMLIMPSGALAQTEPRVTVDVSLNGTADSNPFLETNGASTLSGTLQVDPKVYWEDETTSVVVEASVRMTQYLRRYGNDLSGRVGATATRQLNTRTSFTATAGYLSSRSTLRDFFLGSVNAPLDPVEFPDANFTDVTIAGRRQRIETLDASLGFNHILSEDETINFFGATSYSRLSDTVQPDFRTATIGAGYGRRLSERTTINAGLTGTLADYIGTKNGDARILGPKFGIDNKINERVNWTANIGVSVASVDDALGVSQTKTYLTGSFSICDKGVESALCGSFSRSAEPTALGGVRAVTNLAAVFDKTLSRSERLVLSARYGQTGQSSAPVQITGARNIQIYGASGTYSKDISERLAFVITPSFTKEVERRFRNETNYAVTVGVRLRLGKLR